MQLQIRQSCHFNRWQICRTKGYRCQKLRRWNQSTPLIYCDRNIDSHTYFWSVLPETQEQSRDQSAKRNSLKELELNLSSRLSTKITSSQPDLSSTILTLKKSKKKTLRLLNKEPPWQNNGKLNSAPHIETSQTSRPTKRPHTSDSSSANSDSDLLYPDLFNPSYSFHFIFYPTYLIHFIIQVFFNIFDKIILLKLKIIKK